MDDALAVMQEVQCAPPLVAIFEGGPMDGETIPAWPTWNAYLVHDNSTGIYCRLGFYRRDLSTYDCETVRFKWHEAAARPLEVK